MTATDRDSGVDPAVHVERRDPGAAENRRSSPGCTVGKRSIETAAINDGRGDVAAVDTDAAAEATVEPRRTRDGCDRFAGKIEFSEGVEAEDARAVHRVANLAVLF
jgi:hypothetical protein